jgi:hypothetical protein
LPAEEGPRILPSYCKSNSSTLPTRGKQFGLSVRSHLLATSLRRTLCDQAAMLSLLAILGGILAIYMLTFPYKLARNYITACKTGLPIIIVPIDQNHPLWMVTCVPLRPKFKVSIVYPFLEVPPLLTFRTRNTCQHGSTKDSTSASTDGNSATDSDPSSNMASPGMIRPFSLSLVAEPRSAHVIRNWRGRLPVGRAISSSRAPRR